MGRAFGAVAASMLGDVFFCPYDLGLMYEKEIRRSRQLKIPTLVHDSPHNCFAIDIRGQSDLTQSPFLF
jgi:hypothetical protein